MGLVRPLLAMAALAVLCQSGEAGEGGEVQLEPGLGLVRQQREAARGAGRKEGRKGGKGGKRRKGSKAKKLKRKNKKDRKISKRRQRQKGGKRKKESRHKKPKKQKQKENKVQRRKPGHKGRKLRKSSKLQLARNKKSKVAAGPGRQASSCNGTPLGAACLPDLITTLKFERDKISTFGNQKARVETFKKLIEKKSVKNNAFANTSAYLLVALGGNTSSLNCSFKVDMTKDAAANYNSLANCTTSIPAACTVPDNTANFTQLNTCKTTYKAIQDKNAECLALRTDGPAACSCWGAAANMTTAAKRISPPCDSQAASKKLKTMKDSCLAAFRVCKKAEDSSVGYIMACGSSSSSSSSDSTAAGNSTASGRQLLERGRRELAARLGISDMGSF